MDIATVTSEWLWPAALGVVPLAVLVGVVCRLGWWRPSTRHALCLAVLTCLLATPVAAIVGVQVLAWAGQEASPEAPALVTSDAPASARAAESATVAPIEAAPVSALPAPRVEPAATPRPTPVTQGTRAPIDPIAWTQSRFAPVNPPARPERAASTPARPARRPPTPAPDPVAWMQSAFPSVAASAPRVSAPAPYVGSGSAPATSAPARPEPAETGAPVSMRSAEQPAPVSTADRIPATAAPAATQAWWSTGLEAWRRWLPRLQAVREAVSTLPPVPPLVWVCGAAAIVAIGLVRIGAFARVLRDTEPAPAPVRRLVHGAAQTIGLGRPPQVLMTSRRISPMVWCWGRPRLVLPSQLWEELDDVGRYAVVMHELAHLRRRDHWVRWAEVAASVLYWWHPVVWWVRRRLREEADLCCDAWVTALRPHDRRGYALALVSTRTYLSDSGRTPPVVGLGVMTAPAERFARRLTMVMKARPKPRVSALGVLASLALAVVASSTTPLWACPPKEKAGDKDLPKAKAIVAPKAPHAPKHATGPKPAAAPKVAAPKRSMRTPAGAAPEGATTFEQHMARPRTGTAGPGVQAVPAVPGVPPVPGVRSVPGAPAAPAMQGGGSLEHRLRQLEQRFERLDEQLKRIEKLLERSGRLGLSATTLSPLTAVTPALAPLSLFMAQEQPLMTVQSSQVPSYTMSLIEPDEAGETVIRAYELPKGKRDALWALMAREDIPVLVSQSDGGIRVHGTAHQHRVFGAFVAIIHPEGASSLRSRVEVRDLDRIRGEARTTYERAVAAGEAHQHAGRAEEARRALSHALQMRQHATQIQERASEMETQADVVRDRADQLRERLSGLRGAQRESLQAELRVLLDEARRLAGEARSLEREADRIRDDADRIRERSQDDDDCDEECDDDCSGCEECDGCCDGAEASGSAR